MKRIYSILISITLLLISAAPVFAADGGSTSGSGLADQLTGFILSLIGNFPR